MTNSKLYKWSFLPYLTHIIDPLHQKHSENFKIFKSLKLFNRWVDSYNTWNNAKNSNILQRTTSLKKYWNFGNENWFHLYRPNKCAYAHTNRDAYLTFTDRIKLWAYTILHLKIIRNSIFNSPRLYNYSSIIVWTVGVKGCRWSPWRSAAA